MKWHLRSKDMANYNELEKIAKNSGFTHYAKLDVSSLEFLQEVRDMCNPKQCGRYGKSWSCPPACPSLEEMCAKVKDFKEGILVQTVGDLEDSLDWDGIMETGAHHKENFGKMRTILNKKNVTLLAMGAGECKICINCTYPDAPCRYPDKMEVSMEASGLFVSKVCTDNNLKYNYGPDKIAFVSCFLIGEDFAKIHRENKRETKKQTARELQNAGFNCAQRMLFTYADEFDLDKTLALKITGGLGSGMQQGEVCGAIAGAIMILSLKYGYTKGNDLVAKDYLRSLVQRFNSAFRDKYGTLLCKEILNIDLSIQENLDKARQTGMFKTICAEIVDDVIDILDEIMYEEG